jgi:hypothetical protein
MKIKVTSGLAALTLAWSLQVGAQAAQTVNRESEPANSAFIDWWNGKCATGNRLGLRLEWKANVLWNIDGGLQQSFGYYDHKPFSVMDLLTLSGFIARSGKLFINPFNSGRALAGSEIPRGGSYSAWGTLRSSPLVDIVGSLYLAIPKTSRHGCAGRNPMVVSLVMPQSKTRQNTSSNRLPRHPRRLGLSVSMRVRTRS